MESISSNPASTLSSELKNILSEKKGTEKALLKIYDDLPGIDSSFMLGRWKGFEIVTGHKIEGLLEPSGWYGKLFVDAEQVHPLLFETRNKKKLYSVNPSLIPLGIPFPKIKLLGVIMSLLRPILQTSKPCARLRMITFRGKTTATMAYDSKAIFDHFVKIDENRVLGCMDFKSVPEKFFFVLERDLNQSHKLIL